VAASRLGALDTCEPFGREAPQKTSSVRASSPPEGAGRRGAPRRARRRPAPPLHAPRRQSCRSRSRRGRAHRGRGDYVAITTRAAQPDARHLERLEARLDPERFRVHRSHVVNLDPVRAIRPEDDRRFSIAMDDGAEIVASRAGSQRLRERLR
jgi:hypothetical protein